jgi:hypothetical protein
MIGKSTKNENGSGQSKISIDNDQQISTENVIPTHTHGVEPSAHEIITKGKTITISPKGKGKASQTQDIGEFDVGPSRHRERLLQRTQMDESVFGAPAIPLEILWNHLE